MPAVTKESNARTIAKSLTWRLFGTLDTFLFSWLFTNQIGHASSIASVDTVIKLVLYYLHERLWQRVPLGFFRKKVLGETDEEQLAGLNKESHLRSIIKSLSWRIIGSLTTVLIAYVILGDRTVAWSLGGTEFVSKFILYYFHERLWQLVPRGQFRKFLK